MKQSYLYCLIIGIFLAGLYTLLTIQQSYAQGFAPSPKLSKILGSGAINASTLQDQNIAIITNPANNSALQGTVDIVGSADHVSFQSYIIEIHPEPVTNDQWQIVGDIHEVPVIDGILETWDTTLFPDGSYTLRLRVVRQDGNYSEFLLQQVVISNTQPLPTDTPTVTPTPTFAPPTTTPTNERGDIQQVSPTPLTAPTILPTETATVSPAIANSPEPLPTPVQILSTPTTLPIVQTAIPTETLTPIPPSGEETNTLSLTLADLGYDDVTLGGLSGRATINVGLPTHWEILPGGSLTLFLNHIGLEGGTPTPEPGSGPVLAIQTVNLQVDLNNTPIYQTALTTLGQQSLTIPLPDQWPERIGDRDRLEIFTRVEGVSCEETVHSSVILLKESFLSLAYRSGPINPDLALYPAPIYQPTFFPSTTYIILPDQPSGPQIEAGLALAAGLGELTNNNLVITATTDLAWDQANPLLEHLILIGTPDSNTLIPRLNSVLPVSLHQRRLELVTSGPSVVAPGTHLTYTLQVTNTEATSTALRLRSQLPDAVESINCQPNCQLEDTQTSWDINLLAPNATSTYTLTFVLPTTVTLRAVGLTSELIQNQEIINVSTLHSPVQSDIIPTLTNTKRINDLFFIQNGRAVPETDGIIEFLPSPWQPDKAILLATGLTDEAVFKAGRALGATTHFPGMQGQVALVQEVSQKPYIPLEPPQEFTLANLGYEDRVLSGVGRQDFLYFFDLPLSWNLTEDASVRFLFSHSRLLDPTLSSLNLFFNNTPIASVSLDDENSTAGELTALLPPQSARPGESNRLLVRVETRLPIPCPDPNSDQAWVTLNPASSLSLPHTLNDVTDHLDLDFLPLPYTASPNLADVVFALPEQPSVVEYNAVLRIVSRLAADSDGDNFHPAVLLGDPAEADLSDSHLIVIGRPSRSPLLQMVNAVLPQPFLPGTDTIQQQVDEIIFRLPHDLDLGYLQLIPSNWSSDHALLAVTGTSDQGVGWAAQTLVENSRLQRLKGNLALLREDDISTADTRELTAGGEVAAIATVVPETTIIGTVTPTPRPTPISTVQVASNSNNNVSLSTQPSTPSWFPIMIGGSVVVIFIILGIAYWQARRRKQTTL